MHKFLKTREVIFKGVNYERIYYFERETRNYIMNNHERFLPIILLTVILFIIFIFRNKIKANKKLERKNKIYFALIIMVITTTYYLGNWIISGLAIQ